MPAGRPTKLTPEIQEDLCIVLKAGNYLETACSYTGVSRVTVRAWMKRGTRETKGPYREFLNAIKKAMAAAEVRDVARISEASKEQWQAAAWRLERKNWVRWGRKDKMTAKIEVNWREEAKREGHDANEIFEQMVAAAEARMVREGSGGGLEGSEEAD